MTTRVLVAYATRNRGTAGIAERIGADLISEGLEVKVAPAKAVHSVAGYDAFVLGGAMHGGRWAHDARSFAERFGPQLADRPVWLLSSGPAGRPAGNHDDEPGGAADVPAGRVHARDLKRFGGRLRADPEGLLGLVRRTRHRGHTGDREEQEIDNWAHEVAAELGFGDASSPSGRQPPS
ncbi:flavodoxin domain-containing protein [Actinopolymorpha pittospori]|uniref:Menaquinone-dependent protoporphyrinogen oxidase n=1 Tax=Actinopolymorpha pittospori TaxID=648752 RepID=A0A927RLK2_9ACTN|nr:menaquinone-dependent protoporphyrinogen oxidase [Actinopolymorpha pittospori]